MNAIGPPDDTLLDLTSASYVNVALDLPVDRLFTYRVAKDLRANAGVGHRVRVLFRGRARVGIVAGTPERAPDVDLLDVQEAPDTEPLLSPKLMELAAFISAYYGASFGEAVAAMVPRGVRSKGRGAVRVRVRLAERAIDAIAELEAKAGRTPISSDAAKRVLRHLRRHEEGFVLSDLCRRARVSTSPIKTLEKHGLVTLTREHVVEDALLAELGAGRSADPPRQPTDEQQVAIDALDAAIGSSAFATFLLLGVTGSGKTEVYLRAIETCRAQGRQAIVLVPEIALTPQTVRRFRARFDRVAVLHSGMTESDRARTWKQIRAGDADVVIGPRSAVFAPVPNLGLLVVDEEHETTFKQQNTPRYHARDVGLVRARGAGAVVVLGSATPALESYKNALDGRYGMLKLTHRVAGRSMPEVRIVDLRDPDERPPMRSRLSRTLQVRMRAALDEKGQVILLQNRRGYATSVACARCGFVVPCDHCDIALTYHKSDHVAMCHLCGHEKRVPDACPDCAYAPLLFRGVGTQTIEEELATLFPDAAVARMDSDTMGSRGSYEDVLGRFGRREIDVLVGTQMIAKGLDFPHVTLVGIVSADTALMLPDFRSAERTFGLVAQVAGRAGRGDEVGRVIVQTRLPGHPAIGFAAEQDYEAFAKRELEERKEFRYAPFARLLRVVVRGPREPDVVRRITETRDRVVKNAAPTTEVLGPATPPVARAQGMFRKHLLVKADGHREIRQVLDALRSAPRPRGRVEEVWDVDPVGVV